MITKLDGRQANVMDHALAYPKLHRNHYFSTIGKPCEETWNSLVDLKYAFLLQTQGKYNIYSVTEAGTEALKGYHNATDK